MVPQIQCNAYKLFFSITVPYAGEVEQHVLTDPAVYTSVHFKDYLN